MTRRDRWTPTDDVRDYTGFDPAPRPRGGDYCPGGATVWDWVPKWYWDGTRFWVNRPVAKAA